MTSPYLSEEWHKNHMRLCKDTDLLDLVREELMRQRKLFGEQNHPSHPHDVPQAMRSTANMMRDICNQKAVEKAVTWSDILAEEFYEALSEPDEEKLKTELVQVAAVCMNWLDCINRRQEIEEKEQLPPYPTEP